jgi:glycerophosphoryl diester phosphodiesterase
MSSVEIIAHRGASYDAPENTLTAVQLGWQQQADGVEIDIKLSKDGHIVAFHDHGTARTTGANHTLAELTLAELRDLDAGSWKNARFAGERIPALEEILAIIPPGKRLFIEIKAGPDIVPELKRCI